MVMRMCDHCGAREGYSLKMTPSTTRHQCYLCTTLVRDGHLDREGLTCLCQWARRPCHVCARLERPEVFFDASRAGDIHVLCTFDRLRNHMNDKMRHMRNGTYWSNVENLSVRALRDPAHHATSLAYVCVYSTVRRIALQVSPTRPQTPALNHTRWAFQRPHRPGGFIGSGAGLFEADVAPLHSGAHRRWNAAYRYQ